MTGDAEELAPVTLDRVGDVLMVTLSRADKANALNRRMLASIAAAISAPGPEVKAILIKASGPIFSGGIDLAEVRATDQSHAVPIQGLLGELVRSIERAPLPVVALVQGPCVGGALEMVLACDLRVATPLATFKVPATQIGTVYRAQGLLNLEKRVSQTCIRQLLLLSMELDAPAARRAGIVDIVVDASDPVERLDATISRLIQRPATFAAQKEALLLLSQRRASSADLVEELTQLRATHDSRVGKSTSSTHAGGAR